MQVPKHTMIDAATAIGMILERAIPAPPVMTAIGHAAGSVLARDVYAAEEVPRFTNAGMDGFAIRAGDCGSVPAVLRVVGEIFAGTISRTPLGPGEAMVIMTGAPLPEGATAVIQQEWTEPAGNGQVRILRKVPEGHNCRRAGSDIANGEMVLKEGTVLRAQDVGVLASLGINYIPVIRKPRVALLATGSELADGERDLSPGKIRDSSSPVLSVYLEELGCDILDLGIAKDEPEALDAALQRGCSSDCLITTGGVSVGARDLVMAGLDRIGAELVFWKVNIRPGMPLVFGTRGRTLIFGLPGNVVSSTVTFLQFVRPALLRMSGDLSTDPFLRIPAVLDEPIRKDDGKRHFVRGILERRGGEFRVRTTGPQTSHILTSLVRANCLIILPENITNLPAGSVVEVERLP